MKKIEMTHDVLQSMGYEYDHARRAWFSISDEEHRAAFPPFGFTELMLAKGLQFWVDENGKLAKFYFGEGGIPKRLLYIGGDGE